MNNKLYFRASDGNTGKELWVSDGTASGTQLIKDIYPAGDGDPSLFTKLNGKIYFSASEGSSGDELWMTDGTTAGTQQVKDINPNSGSDTYPFLAFKGKLYLAADDGTALGDQLWAYDPGKDTVAKVAPAIAPEDDPILLNLVKDGILAKTGQTLYFTAGYTTAGYELYKLTADSVTGIETQTHNSALKVWPQPAAQEAHVAFTLAQPSSVQVTLLNASGQEVRSITHEHGLNGYGNGRHELVVDLTGLSSGTYMINVKTDQHSYTRKVIKQ